MIINGVEIKEEKLNKYELSIKKFGSNERTTFEIEAENKLDALERGRVYVLQNNFFNPWIFDTNDIRIEKKLKSKK